MKAYCEARKKNSISRRFMTFLEIRSIMNEVKQRVKKSRAKIVLLFYTKIRLARISRLFKLHSIDDRFERYIKDCLNFKSIMYRDKLTTKAVDRWLHPFFKKLVKITEFISKAETYHQRIVFFQRQFRFLMLRKQRHTSAIRH